MIIKILAIMLTVWYSMSIVGFDIHTCSGSGRSFVVTFIKGLTCEDVHPEHSCNKASCCGGSHSADLCSDCHSDHSDCPFCDGMSVKAKSCCSNDYQSLDLTGIPVSQDHEHFDECVCGFCPCIGFSACGLPEHYNENNLTAYIMGPDSGVGSACERQAALRVWRI